MMTQSEVLNKQNVLYKKLLSCVENNSNSEPFTFWLTKKAKRNTGTRFRFNCGGTKANPFLYTNVGIVKVTSNASKVQLVGFVFTNDFKVCELKLLERNDNKDIIQISNNERIDEIDVRNFFHTIKGTIANINNNQNLSNIENFDEAFISWLEQAYNNFYKAVKDYDNKNNTRFYNVLKITANDFAQMKDKNERAFANNENKAKDDGNGKVSSDNTNPNNSTSPQIPLNQILYGPPGTGKTYHTVEKSLKIIEGENFDANKKFEDLKKEFDKLKENGQIVFTTFHQSMSYEDFVEGIKPFTNKGRITYVVKPGIFKELCSKAKDNSENKYVLIIDEINRGNVSQIFGELITLLEEDKRHGNKFGLEVKLPYSPNDYFGIPSNLYIIGTMNTADRSVEALDTALRRRFSFVEMMPDSSLLKENIDGINLKIVLKTINKRIIVLKDREHQIGHSYFMKCENLNDIKNIFQEKIVPLLQEYFYGNYENICLVLGEGFVKKESNDTTFAAGANYDGDIQDQYRLLTSEEWDELNIQDAIKTLLNSKENID